MPHAMIFEAVRTPRGKGKKDGSLHEVGRCQRHSIGELERIRKAHHAGGCV